MINRFTNLLRSRTARATLVSVALALALLPGVMPALAQAQRTALSGTEVKAFNFGTVSCAWDAGPWHLDQDITATGTFNFGALKSTVVWVANDRLELSSGDGRVWGKITYTADNGVTCQGTGGGKLTGYLLNAQIVAPCSDGSLLKGTLQDVSNDLIGLHSTFEGELLTP